MHSLEILVFVGVDTSFLWDKTNDKAIIQVGTNHLPMYWNATK